MSSKGRKSDHRSGVPYREDSKTRGQHAYAVDKESPSVLSETEPREAKNRALPRNYRPHEPDSGLGYRTLPEPADYQGPLRGPGPRDNRLFPAEGDPQEDESEELAPRSNYEVRSLSKNATAGRHGPAFERGYGEAPSLATRRSGTDSGVITQSALLGIDSAGLSHRALPAQSSQLSPLSHGFVGLGLGSDSKSAHFISENPGILAKSEIEALMAEASIAEKAGQTTRAQTCIYQALLLRECIKLSPDDIGSFFDELTAKDCRAKNAFVKDVTKVYTKIQEQAGRTTQRNPGSTSESYGRRAPGLSQAAERTNPWNVSVNDQIPLVTTQPQTPVARDLDRHLSYTDRHGNSLRPASRRHDSDHHRSFSDPVGMTEGMAAVSIREGTQRGNNAVSGRGNAPGRAGSIHRSATYDPTKGWPTVHEHRQLGSNRPGGSECGPERLDERYRVRQDAKKFFEHGRVFAVLWPEISGNGAGNGSNRGQSEPTDRVAIVDPRFGEAIFSHIRRMVIVKEDHGFCLCLAINTYKGQGVDKHGFSEEDKQAHSIIYAVGTTPSCKQTERPYLDKKAIAVEITSEGQKLDPMSRLNYKKIYTVEHNVKVMGIGRVTRGSLAALLGYWRNALHPPLERPI